MNFFDSIVSFFSAVWSFITNFIESIIIMLQTVNNVVALPLTLVGMVSPVIGTCILIVAAIGILKLILGWGNS